MRVERKMKTALKFCCVFLPVFLLISCNPRIVVKTKNGASLGDDAGILVFGVNDKFDIEAREVGEIQVRDLLLSANSNYNVLVEQLKRKAREIGANCIHIYKHNPPDIWSRNHRVKAKAYYVADITPYEKVIEWHKDRRLKKVDFKGTTENRPFEAITAGYISYVFEFVPLLNDGILKIYTGFDCENSYFKNTENIDEVLQHEQGHFDLWEIYARRLTKTAQERLLTTHNIEVKMAEIYRQIVNECIIEQDRYDSEIYADRRKQSIWLKRIQDELDQLKEFDKKEVFIKNR